MVPGELLCPLLADTVLDYPSVWPLLMLPAFLGIMAARLPWREWMVRASIGRTELAVLAGWIGIGCFLLTGWTYLQTAAFWEPFESREASVAALWRQGGVVYPSPASQERYCAPYGPALSLTLGAAQALFGPGVLSTKVPGVLAALLTLAVFWWLTLRQYRSVPAAWAMTGLLACLLLAFRQLAFWCKPDSLILLAVTASLAAVLRRGLGWQVLVGCCAGWAVDLKPHSAAYFLPVMVLAWRHGWRVRAFLVTGAVAVLVAAAPWVLAARQFPLGNYVAFLSLTLREGGRAHEVLGFGRWIGLLVVLLGLRDRLAQHERPLTPGERRAWWTYHGALALAAALVALPACSVGAGQPHLLSLLPSVLLALGDGFITGVPMRWRPAPGLFWRAVAYSGALACLLIAFQTVVRLADYSGAADADAAACLVDLRGLLRRHADMTVLCGAGGSIGSTPESFRHETVFAGHPVGLDPAAMMDYHQGGAPEPDLGRLTEELQARTHRRVMWLLPRGEQPFSVANIYHGKVPVYSVGFRREFLARFECREQSAFYDVYLPRDLP